MVLPSFVAVASSYNSTTQQNMTLTVPVSVQPGDMCFMFMGIDNGTPIPTWTPSTSGWQTLLLGSTFTNMAVAGMWRRVVAGDPGTITVTGSNFYGSIFAVWYRDCSDPVVLGSAGSRGGVTSFSVTAPSITTTADGQMVITFTGDRSTAATVGEQGPASFSAATYRGGGDGVTTLSAAVGICTTYVGDRIVATAGVTSSDTATYPDSSTNAWAVQVAVSGFQTQAMRVYDGTKTSGRLYYTVDSTGGAGSVKPVLGLSKT